MDDLPNYEYKPAVKSKVSQLESRLASLDNKSFDVVEEKGHLTRQPSQDKECNNNEHEYSKTLQSGYQSKKQEVILHAPAVTDSEKPQIRTLQKQNTVLKSRNNEKINQLSKQTSLLQINTEASSIQSENSKLKNQTSPSIMTANKDAEKTVQSKQQAPIPAPRRHLQKSQSIVTNLRSAFEVQELGNTVVASNSPPPSGSSSSTRRSSEDDGIADMASESDPFDESTMPLPKIRDNAFLLMDRHQPNVPIDEGASYAPMPAAMSLRRGSLNPVSHADEIKEKPRPSRSRTDSTNSAENFVLQQISTSGYDTSKRGSQAEVKIDLLQSKGSQQTVSGIRSPVVVRSTTLSNSAASILVLGLPQSGKSKTIDSLVQRQVTSAVNAVSYPEIIEYTAKIKILDSSNLFSLKIIETPGYSNDSAVTSDAQLMATLTNYLESKDGLRGKPPTVVLVVLRFDDQRLWNPEDEHPDIVNFLKLIHNFQQNLNGNKHANFVFVLTHFLSEHTPDLEQKKPQGKIVELINLIQKYTSLPLPIMVVCAENQKMKRASIVHQNLEDNPGSTPMTVTLPNGETYPYNLIEKIKVLLTKKGRDSVGETVLRTAFGIEYPYSIKECQVTQRIRLFPKTHSNVQQMEKTIRHAYLDIERTEIFTLLEIGWENIDLKVRNKFPESLFTVQQIFQTKKVCNFSDIPEDPMKILNLVRQMPSNLAVKDLLIDTLQLKVPACYPALYIGQGFDLSKDSTTNVSPFQLASGLKTSPVGLIPNEFECKIRDDREICFKFFYEIEEYVSERLKDMKLLYSVSPNSLSALSTVASSSVSSGQRWGYNLIKKNQEPTKSTIATAMIEYRTFQITLHDQEDLKFKPQFWETIQELPDLDIKDSASVSAWKEFFGYWGTHVVKSAFGGGSVEITFRGSVLNKIYSAMKKDFILPSVEYDTTRVFQWITGDGLDFVASCGRDVKNDFVKGYDIEAHFHGGDIKYQQVDLTKFESKEEVANIREDWKESLAVNPVMLETNLVLVPISYFVRNKSEGIATKIDVALHYFYSDFMVSQGKQSSCRIL